MKILSIENIRKGDEFTINNEPITSIDLMERASQNCSNWILNNYDNQQKFVVVSGPGNNGGDGIAIARLLTAQSYNVRVVIIEYTSNYSKDFILNLKRLKEIGITPIIIKSEDDNFEISNNEIIIDAIFGSGLSRDITGFTANIVDYINALNNTIISIDIPSGLFGNTLPTAKNPKIIHANYTLSIAFPKQIFLFSEAESYIGQWHNIDINIHPSYIENVEALGYYVNGYDIVQMIKNRSKFSHKGSYGHALLIAGSNSKFGAAVLASKAALRSGLGLLTTHIPNNAVDILQISSPETMLSIDKNSNHFSEIKISEKINAIGIGPGLGTHKESQRALKQIIQNYNTPIVFDADALNILAENKTWLAFLPPSSILTPHPKEFERLAGKSSNSQDRLILQKEFSRKHKVYVILKGAHTCISTPDGKIFYNSTGNPGMATAGSGDVLTGIILSLLAQSYHPQIASILGVYVHGLAGDIAAVNNGFEALIASDIIDNLGNAFININGMK